MWLRKSKFEKLSNRIDVMQEQADSLYDPLTSRGSSTDKTTRLIAKKIPRSYEQNKALYMANGFVQNIVGAPAEDATREWITITSNMDENENLNIPTMIERRMRELKLQQKLNNLIRYSRMNSKGSFLYYQVKANQVQEGEILADPIPEDFSSIEYINVIEQSDNVTMQIENNYDWTKANYNQVKISIFGQEIHPSRLSWIVYKWLPSEMTGISIIQTINDAIVAQENGLWSITTLLNTMALNIFKSDEIADLSPEQKATLLAKIKHLMITFSAIALKNDESFEQLTLKVEGAKEIFDFIFDNLCGLAEQPKNIVLGKAHGVVTAGEYDTLNYYAKVGTLQENKLRDIIQKNIDMIVRETNGEIYNALNGNIEDLEVEFTFDSLWQLDPLSKAEKDKKESERDQIDISIGKIAPEEARALDPRYKDLDPFETERTPPVDMTLPVIRDESNKTTKDNDKLENGK